MPIIKSLLFLSLLLGMGSLHAKSFSQEILSLSTTDKDLQAYQQGAEHGDAVALTNLGIAYAGGRGVEQNSEKANQMFALAASKNEPRAAYALGLAYNQGLDIPIDYNKAASLYRIAAEQGYVEAQIDLGAKYLRGQGLTQDYAEAIKWFTLAAGQHSPKAQLFLGDIYSSDVASVQNFPEAIKWYSAIAKQGDPEAQMLLANILFFGAPGVSADKTNGLNWLEKSAQQNFLPGQFLLGWIYTMDKDTSGIERNCDTALKWFKKAATLGHAKAMVWRDAIQKEHGHCENVAINTK